MKCQFVPLDDSLVMGAIAVAEMLLTSNGRDGLQVGSFTILQQDGGSSDGTAPSNVDGVTSCDVLEDRCCHGELSSLGNRKGRSGNESA
jgi:hypothetical protein